jgi:hypothetical protein
MFLYCSLHITAQKILQAHNPLTHCVPVHKALIMAWAEILFLSQGCAHLIRNGKNEKKLFTASTVQK